MADANNTLSHEHVVSRRTAIKGAASTAAAAVAVGAVAGIGMTEAGETIAATASAPWPPQDCKSLCFSLLDEDAFNPLTIITSSGGYRRATFEELGRCIDRRPFQSDHVDPDVLRRLFRDSDGELLALFSERRRASRQQHAFEPDTPEHESACEAVAQIEDRICNTQALTKAGAAHQLRFLSEAVFYHGRGLSYEQQRQLIWSATYVLEVELRQHESGARHISEGVVLTDEDLKPEEVS